MRQTLAILAACSLVAVCYIRVSTAQPTQASDEIVLKLHGKDRIEVHVGDICFVTGDLSFQQSQGAIATVKANNALTYTCGNVTVVSDTITSKIRGGLFSKDHGRFKAIR